jgi:hypothetical protein
MKKFLAALILLVIVSGSAISDAPPKESEFVFARLACTNRDSWRHWPQYFPWNPPWHHDYPASDEFFTGILHELTGIRVTSESYQIVKLDSSDIFKYPFLYLSEPGFMVLNDKEIANLGEYIRRGGFIVADDFRTGKYLGGPEELEVLRYYLKRALPERDLVRLDISNPIFHTYYDIDTLKMSPPYGDFVPEFWGMFDEHGTLQLIAYYNNDIGDFWKYLDYGDKPLKDSTRSIRMGVNDVIYAMSH